MSEKAIKNVDGLVVTTAVIASILGVSTRRVQVLVEESVIDRIKNGTFELVSTLKKYIAHIRLKGDGKAEKESLYEQIQSEELRIKAAKAEMEEIKLALMLGRVHDAEDVQKVMIDMISGMKAKLLNIPSKLSPQIVGQNDRAVVQDILLNGINEALQELSDYKPGMFHGNDYIDLDSLEGDDLDEEQ